MSQTEAPADHESGRVAIPLAPVAALPVIATALAAAWSQPRTHPGPLLLLAGIAVLAAMFARQRTLVTSTAAMAMLGLGISTGYQFRTTHSSWALYIGASLVVSWCVAELCQRIAQLRQQATRMVQELDAEHSRGMVSDRLEGSARRNPVERELQRAARYARTATVVIAELDNVELLRERIGTHAVRDALLDLADLIGEDTRVPDDGTIEQEHRIAIVLPETPVLGGRVVAERARLRFQAIAVPGADGAAVTARFGVASFPQDGDTPDDIVLAAGVALDDAGRRGGNRTVITAAPDVPPGWTVDVTDRWTP